MDSLLLAGLNNAAWATALAVVVAAIGKACGHRRPALLHALWLLVLVKLLTPSLVRIESGRWNEGLQPEPSIASPIVEESPRVGGRGRASAMPPDAEAFNPGGIADARPRPPLSKISRRGMWSWQKGVGFTWLIGSITWCSAVALGMIRFRRLIRSARPASDGLRAQVDRMAAKLDLRRSPATFVVPAQIPPMLWALVGRPRLILPEDLWDRLSDDERDAILAHELAHLKRRDEWARRLEAIALGLYWWNPVAWWARREVERTEEQCCDAWVLWALPDSATAYARALVRTADFLSESNSRHPWPAGASGAGHLPPLKRRLTMILNHAAEGSNPAPRPVSRPVLILAGLTLLLLPAWALSEPPKAEPANLEQMKAALDAFKAKYGDFPPSRIVIAQAEDAKIEPAAKPAPKAPVLDAPPEIADKVKFAQVISTEVSDKQLYVGSLVAANPITVLAPREGKIKFLHASGLIVEKGAPLLQFVSDDKGEKATEVIGSPVLGIISYGQLFPGSQGLRPIKDVKSGRPLLFIRPTDSISVDYHLDQSTYLKIKRQKLAADQKSALTLGAPVEVQVAGDPGRFRGQVVSVESQFDPKSQTLSCRASFPNPEGIFIPGMSASVRFVTGPLREAPTLPRNAPLGGSDGGGQYVLVVNDHDELEMRMVTLLQGESGAFLVTESGIAVKKGLKEGEWVVTSGHTMVMPGMKVKR